MRTFDRLLRTHRRLFELEKVQNKTFSQRIEYDRKRRWFDTIASRRFGAVIYPSADIADDVVFWHDLHGIFIGGGVVIGSKTEIFHHVTIGAGIQPGYPAPKIGAGVFLGANSTIIGRTTIGDGAKIGAGVTLVDVDIPPGAVIVNSSAYDLANRVPVYPGYKATSAARL